MKEWAWYDIEITDLCPTGGYFSEKVPGLIEQYGDRLDLLRSAT